MITRFQLVAWLNGGFLIISQTGNNYVPVDPDCHKDGVVCHFYKAHPSFCAKGMKGPWMCLGFATKTSADQMVNLGQLTWRQDQGIAVPVGEARLSMGNVPPRRWA